jgi:hypothetical protein
MTPPSSQARKPSPRDRVKAVRRIAAIAASFNPKRSNLLAGWRKSNFDWEPTKRLSEIGLPTTESDKNDLAHTRQQCGDNVAHGERHDDD